MRWRAYLKLGRGGILKLGDRKIKHSEGKMVEGRKEAKGTVLLYMYINSMSFSI